ncbi:MAG TPA: hypothetical protein PKA53_12895 [Sphingobacterium sp.]|nr:hypothetical protein [Sphingobacterium sp.]
MDSILQEASREQLILLIVSSISFPIVWLVLAYHVKRLIQLVRKENRFFTPGQSWILAIPLLNIFYNFIMIRRICDSLNNEFYDRREAVDENPTLRQGYYMAFGFLAANFPLPIFIAYLVYIASMAYYINYLIKVLAYKKLLQQPPPLSDNEVSVDKENIRL